ncbi:MAG: methyltransferase domain-containing protein [Anaerolineae bacterium]|nr:methyltransferase domain-containing protein [Anaerolineae bacterium]
MNSSVQIDQDRIRAIFQGKHSYYGGRHAIRVDNRWYPDWQHIIVPQLSPAMRVLDVGCGNGGFLLELNASFDTGLGVDNDPIHVRMAEEAKRAEGIHNVNFLLLDYPREIAQLQLESFDMVVSLRGPLPDTTEGIQAAHHLLHADGLLYCEEIAERHQKEVVDIFPELLQGDEATTRTADRVTALFEQNGFDVRLAADVFTKWIYPDVYAWAELISNLWTWLGVPLPEPDDPRIALFAERNTIATGEIETMHHVAWVAGVKQ